MTNFAIQGTTLNGNTVIQYNGINIYLRPTGEPIRYEKAWFKIENPKRILAESAEYILNLTKQKMLREGLYFIGHVQRVTEEKYRIITWDHTYIILETESLKEIEEFVIKNSYTKEEIEDNQNESIAHRVPYNKNGIVYNDNPDGFGYFYKDCRKFNYE